MARDYSGYGEACRHDVGALVSAGVDVTTQIPSYVLEMTDFGKVGALCINLENKPLGYKIKILHTTPNVYTQFMEPNVYHIARAFWETDKLPPDFAKGIQLCNEAWTGSEYNAQAMRNAGVTIPIYIIPEAIDTDIGQVDPYITNITDFTFYSIFEWTERKNPFALLTAYWQEFDTSDNVALVIKTYIDNFQKDKRDEINNYIKRIKKQMPQPYYAPLYLYRNLMDRRQIYRFHKTFNCFVSTHRGEGWGVPQMEAMLLEKPIISTNCGGIHEYLTDKTDAMLVPYAKSKVDNSRNKQWYLPDQWWASVDIEALRKTLRYAYEHQDEVKQMGIKGAQTVKDKFALKAVGLQMLERLKIIQRSLEPQAI